MTKKPKKMISLIMILLGGVYILNPSAGLLELIPDNLPLIGNLDEAGAVYLIFLGLRGFGVDLTHYFEPKK